MENKFDDKAKQIFDDPQFSEVKGVLVIGYEENKPGLTFNWGTGAGNTEDEEVIKGLAQLFMDFAEQRINAALKGGGEL